jgi:hypothetical protein
MIRRGNRSTGRKPNPMPLGPPQTTHFCPGANPGRRGGKPAANRLSYGTAYIITNIWGLGFDSHPGKQLLLLLTGVFSLFPSHYSQLLEIYLKIGRGRFVPNLSFAIIFQLETTDYITYIQLREHSDINLKIHTPLTHFLYQAIGYGVKRLDDQWIMNCNNVEDSCRGTIPVFAWKYWVKPTKSG